MFLCIAKIKTHISRVEDFVYEARKPEKLGIQLSVQQNMRVFWGITNFAPAFLDRINMCIFLYISAKSIARVLKFNMLSRKNKVGYRRGSWQNILFFFFSK
jgi:hypothetical protein